MAGNDCGALLDEELSSFFLNYLAADTQVRPPGPRARARGAGLWGWPPPQPRKLGDSGGRIAGIGVPGCRAPVRAPCEPLSQGGRGLAAPRAGRSVVGARLRRRV